MCCIKVFSILKGLNPGILLPFFLLPAAVYPVRAQSEFGSGPVVIRYDTARGMFDATWHGITRIRDAFARVRLGTEPVTSREYDNRVPAVSPFNGPFGPGIKVEITSSGEPAAVMKQVFYINKAMNILKLSRGQKRLVYVTEIFLSIFNKFYEPF